MTDTPVRVQRSRARGSRMHKDGRRVRYVGRPGPFGNPFWVARTTTGLWQVHPDLPYDVAVSLYGTKEDALAGAVTAYREWVSGDDRYPNYYSIDRSTYSRSWVRAQAPVLLVGCDLACWCRPEWACHADVLLELANPEVIGRPGGMPILPTAKGHE